MFEHMGDTILTPLEAFDYGNKIVKIARLVK